MSRSKTSDITKEFKKMRKCKIIELLKSPEIDLTDEELNIFLLRLNYYNDGVSEKVGKCPRSITTIFMNVNLTGCRFNSGNSSTTKHYSKDTNSSCGNAQVKNSRNVNIVHMDAKVLVYTWLISFLTVLFLACAGYLILDGKIDSNSEKINAIAVGLLQSD